MINVKNVKPKKISKKDVKIKDDKIFIVFYLGFFFLYGFDKIKKTLSKYIKLHFFDNSCKTLFIIIDTDQTNMV